MVDARNPSITDNSSLYFWTRDLGHELTFGNAAIAPLAKGLDFGQGELLGGYRMDLDVDIGLLDSGDKRTLPTPKVSPCAALRGGGFATS